MIDPLKEIKSHPDFPMLSAVSQAQLDFQLKVYDGRRALGISQKEFAKRCKTSQKIISNIEQGIYNNPGLDLMTRINFNLK